ncbi:E3 SUMO-protein ligase ZNF451 [Megalops cyprinoides]|uniref:E3 SUMO-protein ligase ZNF451 n=1 Tax=Megalops cyprinoides TaxID=118141 RepID=UPI001863DA65|nr:E3 SUMO-protein ligase ZNF451 [Megalops cyprinoides]XP_036402735.1 E3 SUMO-protein ligase ZNF451 [Megalops cyprinoides]XP_036402736.1 E3 SUMO-protein ligase ZNF451 [Megalops cyprinoides]
MMASSAATDEAEDEVEFVSEGPLRPVLEYIDLLSDGEDGDTPVSETIEDQVDRQKAKVASTLDRLARQVAVEKKERAEKCKAFKEKMVTQQAHGRQELAFSRSNGESRDAKHCVDMWLKMPGLRPGVLHTGYRRGRRSAPCPTNQSSTHACPVVNCGRVYDSVLLLEGHLKRFDHSPCDPTILLKGGPSESYACVACSERFDTKESWEGHQRSKVASAKAEGHVSTHTCQLIQCFACPSCFLLFSIRDQCLQHMSAKNHFSQALKMTDMKTLANPIPIPRYAKNRLIALCRDVPFCVRCTACRKVLSSHMEARAHFNVHCRQGGAIAEADQTVAQVMSQLRALGHCSQCTRLFFQDGQVERHKQKTQHEVELFTTMEQSVLHYCNYYDTLNTQQKVAKVGSKRPSPQTPSQKRDTEKDGFVGSPAKKQRHQTERVAWVCECGLQFPEEATAHKHLLAANQIFHKCGVCGKEMGEASIARLHMSRFHGGAHLSNFLFRCRRCQVDMPRQEDILSHVGDAHHGHTFYREQEVTEEEHRSASTSTSHVKHSAKAKASQSAPAAQTSRAKRAERWLCRMCEDLFDSEAAVQEHCGDVGSHSFQRFLCGQCGQKFFKEATLRRHCEREHGGRAELRYFCGLCDSMQQDTEEEFLLHYQSLHSRDYYRMEEEDQESQGDTPGPSVKDPCPCMATEKDKAQRKTVFTQCMKRLASSGQCSYVCSPCNLRTPYYIQMKAHMQHEHTSVDKSFEVTCGSCPMSCSDVPSFHTHYHSQHCPLEPCVHLRGKGAEVKDTASILKVLKAEEISPETNAVEYEEVKRITLSSEETQRNTEGDKDEYDDDLKRALALSVEETRKQTELDRGMSRLISISFR